MATFPEYPVSDRLDGAADTRLTRVATGGRMVDIYGHPIEGDKQFRADLSTALHEITAARAALEIAADLVALLPSPELDKDDLRAAVVRRLWASLPADAEPA